MLDPFALLSRFFGREIWRDLAPLIWPRRWAYGLLRVLYVLWRDIMTGQLTLHAMSLVYTTLLSLVPLLAVSFSVLKGFGVHNQVEPLLYNLLEPLGPKGEELTLRILEFVENMKVGVLGSVGLAMLLYTVVSLIEKIEGAFNYVWDVKRSRSVARRFSDYLSVIVVGPVLVFSAVGMTASFMASDIIQRIVAYEPFGTLVAAAGTLAPFVIIVLAFTFIYSFVPNTKVWLKSAFVGALTGGVLWQSIGYGFASFAAGSTRYDAIYSSFAILLLFMIWLYLAWLVLLLGAQVAYYFQHPHRIRRDPVPQHFTPRQRQRAALLVLYLVVRAFERGERAWDFDRIAGYLRLPSEPLSEVVDELIGEGLLVQSADEPPGLLPARDPDSITALEVLERIGGSDELGLPQAAVEASTAIDAVLAKSEGPANEALADLSLRDLVGRRLE